MTSPRLWPQLMNGGSIVGQLSRLRIRLWWRLVNRLPPRAVPPGSSTCGGPIPAIPLAFENKKGQGGHQAETKRKANTKADREGSSAAA